MTGILSGFEHVPPRFEVLAKLCTLLRDPFVDLSRIVEYVALDPGLAAAVVRLSNSPFYGCSEPIEHIEDAVQRVGFTEVLKMVGVLGRKSFPACPLRCYNMSDETAWREALGAAVLMEYMAYHADLEPGTAYLVGLMHGIGRYPIARRMATVKPGVCNMERLGFVDQSRWERETVGTDSAATGSALLRLWNFGPEVYQPVAEHLHPFLRQGERKMASLLHICLLCLPGMLDGYDDVIPELPPSWLQSLGMTEAILRSCIAPSRAWLQSTDGMFALCLRDSA
jgi:HD-like signal output (HDOD) protein